MVPNGQRNWTGRSLGRLRNPSLKVIPHLLQFRNEHSSCEKTMIVEEMLNATVHTLISGVDLARVF